MKNQKLISIGAGMAAIASIAGGTLFALNSTSGSSSALGLSDGELNTIAANVAATPEADRDAYLTKLAANLGVDVEKLKSAIQASNLQVLDEKVTDGSIPQDRADEMRKRIESGNSFFFGVGGHGKPGEGGPGSSGERGPGGPGGPGMGVNAEGLSTFLGIDAATLRSEQEAGKSLATIATEHGKTRDQLKAFLSASIKTSLAQGVSDGKITQAQADERLAAFTASVDDQIDEIHTPGERGPRGGKTPPTGSAPSTSPAPTN